MIVGGCDNLEISIESKVRVTLRWDREGFHLLSILAGSETTKEEDGVFMLLNGKAKCHGKGKRSIRDDTLVESILDLLPSRIFHKIIKSGLSTLESKLSGETLFQLLKFSVLKSLNLARNFIRPDPCRLLISHAATESIYR